MDVTTYALLNKKIKGVSTQVSGLAEGFTYKGSKSSVESLPADADNGDLYTVGGKKYVYDGNDWVELKDSVQLDTTLSVSGKAADAKATGDAIEAVADDVSELETTVTAQSEAIGDLSELETTDKSSLVAAINEAATTGGGGSSAIVNKIENVAIASFADGTDSAVKSLVVAVDPVQDLHGYDNPWPAGGGANLCPDFQDDTQIDVTLTNNGGTITLNGTAAANRFFEVSVNFPSGNYAISLFNPSATSGDSDVIMYFIRTDQNAAEIKANGINKNTTFSVTTAITQIRIRVASGAELNNFKLSPMLVADSTAPTTFSPYSNICPITGWTGVDVYQSGADTSNPTTIPIIFPDAAGTVYGGTLTNNGTDEWELVVDRGEIDLGDYTWNYVNAEDHQRFQLTISDIMSVGSSEMSNIMCSIYKTTSGNGVYTHTSPYTIGQADQQINIYNPDYTDAATFKTAMSGVQLVYELATPIEYTITASQLETLLGINNIWADTGNINLLEYNADGKTYIDEQNAIVKALIAKELPSMVADTALVKNDFRIVNNTLYKVTTSIASGATLTVGTNVVATTLAEVIKPLLT